MCIRKMTCEVYLSTKTNCMIIACNKHSKNSVSKELLFINCVCVLNTGSGSKFTAARGCCLGRCMPEFYRENLEAP